MHVCVWVYVCMQFMLYPICVCKTFQRQVEVLTPTNDILVTLKVAEHGFGSLWVYVICQIMAREKVAAHKLKLGKWKISLFLSLHKIFL